MLMLHTTDTGLTFLYIKINNYVAWQCQKLTLSTLIDNCENLFSFCKEWEMFRVK